MKAIINANGSVEVLDIAEVQLAAELIAALQKSRMVPAGTSMSLRTGKQVPVFRPAGEVAEERRHRAEERRKRDVERVIRTNPDAPDTEIAKMSGIDPEAVAAYRREISEKLLGAESSLTTRQRDTLIYLRENDTPPGVHLSAVSKHFGIGLGGADSRLVQLERYGLAVKVSAGHYRARSITNPA